MAAAKGDSLKLPEEAYFPDSRNIAFGLNDISDQYNRIEKYQLAEYVPEKVTTQYEVARNLYLYSFNVYRFYMVAQHQALVTLEFAIKEAIGKKKIKKYGEKIKKGGGLAGCLNYIFDKGLVDNSDFPAWINQHKAQAERKYEITKIKEMEEKGLKSIEINYNEIDYDEHTIEYDYLEILSENMPKTRNNFAHGASTLHNQVLSTFENVSIIINKIYLKKK